jgi:hypothetical protein
MEILLSDDVFRLEPIFTVPGALTYLTIPDELIVKAGETASAELYLWTSWTAHYVSASAWRKCPESTTCYVEPGGGFVYKGKESVRAVSIRTTLDTPRGVHNIPVDIDYTHSDFDPVVQGFGGLIRLRVK